MVTGPVPSVSKELNADAMMAAAVADTGLQDFGDEGFRESLSRYLDAVVAEARLSPLGVQAEKMHVHGLLVNRLRFHHDQNAHPEMLDEDVSDPIVIIGMPRTGTTKLQRMMSNDPRVQMLAGWQVLNPAPFPDAPDEAEDPRIGVARMYEQIMAEQYPQIMAAHPWRAEEADEEWLLLLMTFASGGNAQRVRVPSFRSWLQTFSQRPVYDYLHGLLQYLQWQQGGRRGPWVLKSPTTHLDNLDLLFEAFPNATVAHCHRDVREAMPSIFGLLELVWGLESDEVDQLEVGAEALHFWSWAIEKNLALRDQLGEDPRIVDVQYSDICDDPLAVIARIYQARGWGLDPEAERLMVQWQGDNPQHRFGKHSYGLEPYGVTTEMIDQTFSRYVERFGTTWTRPVKGAS